MHIGSRALFPHLDAFVYANHASVGPLPTPAIEAVHRICITQATHGVAAMADFHADVEDTRKIAGQLMGVKPENIAVTGSTSLAISAVAASLPWKSGDRIVLFKGEFPANTTPWQLAAKRHGLEIAWIDANRFDGGDGMAQLEGVLKQGQVRMIAVSAVQFNTGLRMPVEEMATLAHHHGAEIFVDAIQALGATPFDSTDLDYVASGGQKWLMGPPGAALLYAKDWSRLEPTLAGWLSHEDGLVFLFGEPDLLRYDRPIQVGPAMIEGGTLNFAGIAGLTAAMGLVVEMGIDHVYAHANQWLDGIEPTLVELGFTSLRSKAPARRSCILCAKPPAGQHAGELATALGEHGISVASPDGAVRFSPSWPNALSEIAVVQAALRTVCG
jgi:selenocysteine lyase/cysteine desulfurase